jgi:fructose-1,6-bisphosphatase/inositol monophosphatase family enzyme
MCRRRVLKVDGKADRSPVTEADRGAEQAMRVAIHEAFPSHSIFGEEFGMDTCSASGEWLWVLDPIDGTKSFITGAWVKGSKCSVELQCTIQGTWGRNCGLIR